MSIKDELLGDLEKMSFSTFEDEGRYTAISVKCDDCRLKLQCLKCEGPECRQETLNYIAVHLSALGYRKVDDVKELIIKFFAGWKAHYPESVFLPRPAGEHSPTFDGCAGRTMRAMVPIIEKNLLEKIEEWMTETGFCSEGEPKEDKANE
jgi:hypothetical protein